MNFDKESKSEYFLCLCVWERGGGGVGGWWVPICIRLFLVLMLCIKFQVPSSSSSLVLIETKGIDKRHNSANV